MEESKTTTIVWKALTGRLGGLLSGRSTTVVAAAVVLSAANVASGQPNEVLKLLASDGAAGDQFGFVASIDGDTVIVSAPVDDHQGPPFLEFAGSAYIYQQDWAGPDNWGEVKKLVANDAADFDSFGYSVSISGDIAIVGSPQNDHSEVEDPGAAYVFYRDQGGPNDWGFVAKLIAEDAALFDFFGQSVAISGDFAIVGSPFDDDVQTNAGSAYIFYRHQGGTNAWGQVAKLTASDAAAVDEFGGAVAIHGDVVVIGARRNDDAGSLSGSAYIFQKPSGGWRTQTKKL